MEKQFGAKRVLRDYGSVSDATSDTVKSEVYESGDVKRIALAIEKQNAALVAGHFPINKYGGILGLRNTVTIFRDPVEQVISHYRHAVRDHGYKQDLMTFAQQGGIRNLQSRMLANVDPALIGVVGLTEAYKETLALVSHHWGLKLRPKKMNVSDRLGKPWYEVSDEEKQEIERLNTHDREIYKRACHVFGNTLHCFKQGINSDPRGAITLADTTQGVRGWAFDMMSESTIEILVLINGIPQHRTTCGAFLPTIACWKVPRDGYVSFAFETNALKVGDSVEIRDSQSGLSLAITSVSGSG